MPECAASFPCACSSDSASCLLEAGASIVCTPGFFDTFFAWLEEFRPTWYTAVPAIHQAILAHAAHTVKSLALPATFHPLSFRAFAAAVVRS